MQPFSYVSPRDWIRRVSHSLPPEQDTLDHRELNVMANRKMGQTAEIMAKGLTFKNISFKFILCVKLMPNGRESCPSADICERQKKVCICKITSVLSSESMNSILLKQNSVEPQCDAIEAPRYNDTRRNTPPYTAPGV